MYKKIIFFLVEHRIRIVSKIFHTLKILLQIFSSGMNYQNRSPILFHWSKTFIPYIQSSEWMDSVVDGLTPDDQLFLRKILKNIEYIAYHNIVDYRDLYTSHDEDEQVKYLQYLKSQPNDNYFKQRGYGLMNEYSIFRDMERLAISITDGDILDCGAFNGDSAIAFSDYFPQAHVYAVEPHPDNYTTLKSVVEIHKKQESITALNYGVGKENTSAFLSDEGIGSKLADTGIQIHVRTIDSLVEEYNLRPKLIKWDIEGFEYSSILGTTETMKKYKPVLFISVYHHGRDLFEAKKYIQDLQLGYKFTFTRWDTMTPFSDTILICY